MPIPDLTLAAGRTNYSEATAAPDNGDNTFAHNWDLDPDKIDTDQIDIEVIPQGPSVTGVAFVALSADGLSLTLSFVQTGADEVQVIARHVHSLSQ